MVIRIEFLVVLYVSVVIERLKIAFVVKLVEGVFLVFDVVDKENAVEVVDFMHKGASEEIGCLEANFGAVFELGLNANFGWAGNFAVNGRNREAAFVIVEDFALGFDNFWVKQWNKSGIILIAHVFTDNNDALIVAKLWGSHSGRKLEFVLIFPINTGLNHLFDDFGNFWVVYFGLSGFFAQARIWCSDDCFLFH